MGVSDHRNAIAVGISGLGDGDVVGVDDELKPGDCVPLYVEEKSNQGLTKAKDPAASRFDQVSGPGRQRAVANELLEQMGEGQEAISILHSEDVIGADNSVTNLPAKKKAAHRQEKAATGRANKEAYFAAQAAMTGSEVQKQKSVDDAPLLLTVKNDATTSSTSAKEKSKKNDDVDSAKPKQAVGDVEVEVDNDYASTATPDLKQLVDDSNLTMSSPDGSQTGLDRLVVEGHMMQKAETQESVTIFASDDSNVDDTKKQKAKDLLEALDLVDDAHYSPTAGGNAQGTAASIAAKPSVTSHNDEYTEKSEVKTSTSTPGDGARAGMDSTTATSTATSSTSTAQTQSGSVTLRSAGGKHHHGGQYTPATQVDVDNKESGRGQAAAQEEVDEAMRKMVNKKEHREQLAKGRADKQESVMRKLNANNSTKEERKRRAEEMIKRGKDSGITFQDNSGGGEKIS